MRRFLFGGFGPFKRDAALRDVFAGLTLAFMNIPQVLGYARIAGMPVVTGLYTVLLPLVAFAAFGSSRHLIVAADSATAVIFSSQLSHMATLASAKYMALVGMVALLTAGLLFLARVFKLGFLADFLSRTVLVGFLTGVGFQVAAAMLGEMFGVAVAAHSTLLQVFQVLQSLAQVSLPTMALSTVVVVAILAGGRVAPRLPVSLFAVAGSIAASAAYRFADRGIAVIGPVPGGLPPLGFPDVTWSEVLALLPVAASCFVMIVAQSAATSRAFAMRYDERVDENADILGLSAANAVAAISGTFVVNGSPTQTAMAERAGARSQIAQLVFAAVVLVVLLFLTGPLQDLPRCVLASIVFTIAIGMIDVKGLRAIRSESPGEFYLAAGTAAAVVAIGVEQGILLAIALSLFRHVRHSYSPHSMMLAPDQADRWIPVPAIPGKETAPGLIVYRFGADLFYANVNRFADEVRALLDRAPTPVHWFIVDASAMTDIDYAAAQTLRNVLDDLKRRKVEVAFARVTSYLRSDMDRHHITPVVTEKRIFATLHEAIAAVRGDPVGAQLEQ
ncbi:MAG: SulP family inorganic anion transporter [Xanthobacteraceae bacterium]|jgi:high affinity sulfate transporter 1